MNNFYSIKNKSISKVLFLRGVFLKDCKTCEEIFQERLDNLDSVDDEDVQIYEELPHCFTSFEKWKKKSNNKCWYCHLYFDTVPWFEPKTIEPSKDTSNSEGYTITINGNFCSVGCVLAYINKHTTTLEERHNKIQMLRFVYEIFEKKSIINITSSPSPTIMKCYDSSGITEEEYRVCVRQLNKQPSETDSPAYTVIHDSNFT